MKKLNKKGFTIVELVIVIAVIAILAAVLIPTFGGVINNAKESANKQDATNTYKQLLTEQEYLGDLDLADGNVVDLYILVGEGEDAVVYKVIDGKIEKATDLAWDAIPSEADADQDGDLIYGAPEADGYDNVKVYVDTYEATDPDEGN